MPTKEEEYLKEIARLEEDKRQWIEERSNFLKEQKASIVVFNEKEKEIKNLNKSLEVLTGEKKVVDERLEKLFNQNKELFKELKTGRKEYSSLETQRDDLITENTELRKYKKYREEQKPVELKEKNELIETVKSLSQKYLELEGSNNKQGTLINQFGNDLQGQKEKNQMLEKRLRDAEDKLIEKDQKIIKLEVELKNTRDNNRFLNELCQKIEGKVKGGFRWHSNKDTFIQIMTENFPAERIKEKLGDIYGGWMNDASFEMLTPEDKAKIKAYDKLVAEGDLNKLKATIKQLSSLTVPKLVKK